jgi:hypothetical protein
MKAPPKISRLSPQMPELAHRGAAEAREPATWPDRDANDPFRSWVARSNCVMQHLLGVHAIIMED